MSNLLRWTGLLFLLLALSNSVCAWCLEEQGEAPAETDSHGVCQPHADQMLLNYYQQKFDAVPSYVSRFADGRESWDDEEGTDE